MLQGRYPLLIALVLGLMAGIIAYSAIKKREKDVREGWYPKRILCAQQDIEEGTELDEQLVDVCEIPEKFVTESFIVVPEAEDKDSLIPYGQKIIVPLKTHDPILYSHFEARKEFALSDAVPTKARAISVEVSEKSSVNQLIRPNDHVDIIGTFRDTEGGKGELQTTTVLQNIIVLATGRTTGTSVRETEEDKKYTHVAVLVTPTEAEMLALAQEAGTLDLTLRNKEDIENLETRDTKTTLATLFTGEKVELQKRMNTIQAPIKVDDRIDVIRGKTSREKETIDPKSPRDKEILDKIQGAQRQK